MNYRTILTNLYFLLIHADGKVNEREIAFGKQMMQTENIDKNEFEAQLALLQSRDVNKIYSESLTGLKKLNKREQVRCIAWLSVIANADGFMDRTEWQFIYALYHKELHLSLDEVMKAQKDLFQVKRDAMMA